MKRFILILLAVFALPALGQVPWREATTTEMANGTAGTPVAVTPRRLAGTLGGTNGVGAYSFGVVLHTNKTASVYVSGAPSVLSFPNSTTAGWNEVQALFQTRSNSLFGGFRMIIDPGLYLFTTQLIVTNNCWIAGAGPSETIFRYVGTTNLATISQITNILAGATGAACVFRAAPYSLLYCSTNLQNQGGIEPNDAYSVILENFTVQISTNMPCVLATISGGDHTVLNNVFVAGPELWTKPSYYNGFLDYDMIPASSSAIGFIIGGNQPVLNHCRAVAVADGLVPLGDSFLTVNDFNAIVVGNYAGLDEATPYPATSEFSLMNGILVPTISQCEYLSVNHVLFFDCINDFYFGPSGLIVKVQEWRDQNELFQPDNIEIYRGGTAYPTIRIDGTKDTITVQTYTNDATGYRVNNSTNAYLINQPLAIDGLWQISDGHAVVFQQDRTGVFWTGTVNNNVTLQAGRTFNGNGSGVTNIAAQPNLTFPTNTIYAATNTAPLARVNNPLSNGSTYTTPNAQGFVTGSITLTNQGWGYISNVTTLYAIRLGPVTGSTGTNDWPFALRTAPGDVVVWTNGSASAGSPRTSEWRP